MAAQVHPVDAATAAASKPSRNSTTFHVGFWQAQFQAMREEGFLGTLAMKSKPNELRERLKGIWITLGVVSALLAAVALPSVVSPSTTWSARPTVSMAAKAYVYLVMSSFGLSFTVVVMCTMLVFSIDLMPTGEFIFKFVCRFQYMNDVGVLMFIASIVALVLGCAAAVYDNYGWLPFVIVSCYLAALLLVLGLSFSHVHTFNATSIVTHRMSCKDELSHAPSLSATSEGPSGPQTLLAATTVEEISDDSAPVLARRSRARLGV